MSEGKFQPTGEDVIEFIESIGHAKKEQDAYTLVEMFQEVTGHEPKMWYPSIIGFGDYHYVYESGREGDSALLAFSPRKAKISLYLEPEFPEREEMLTRLGKHTSGKSCVYVNKLADVNLDVLKEMLAASLRYTLTKYPEAK
ncbi:DUF1801 domain-containing protein [Fundicoccus sp. Sow4_H7]|uniref:DUF1801 domain-containing protein n=1 Tax=Fundicoccus sp. Sow4_H7 TaxID=3438784 RepID=UPI003F901D65